MSMAVFHQMSVQLIRSCILPLIKYVEFVLTHGPSFIVSDHVDNVSCQIYLLAACLNIWVFRHMDIVVL